MFNRIVFTSFLLIICFISTSWSATISGTVLDSKNGKPLPDANLMIEKTTIGTASRDGGYYALNDLQNGEYTVTVQIIGYKTIREDVIVDRDVIHNFKLEAEPIQFDPILASATRTDHRQSQVTASTEILTARRLQESPGITAGEILEGSGSLYFKSYDQLAGLQIPSIRGVNPEQVLVLLDDMPLNGVQGGGVDLNNIPVSALEQIEIVKGGHSAIYGTDAVGGLIHLISKSPLPDQTSQIGIRSTIGSFGLQTADLLYTNTAGAFHYFINYSRNKSQGDYTYIPEGATERIERQNNDFCMNNLFAKAQYQLNTQNHMQFVFQLLDSERGVSGSLIYPSPQARRDETRRIFSFQLENQLSRKVRLRHLIYNQYYDNKYNDPGAWIPDDDRHITRSSGYQLQTQIQTHSSLQWVTGAEFQVDELKSTLFSIKRRKQGSLFLQAEWTSRTQKIGLPVTMKLLPAIRHDAYEHMGSQTSPKVGALIGIGSEQSLAIRANWGRSYRAPSFNDLYWPADMFSQGNPELEPETGTSFDFGISLRQSYGLDALYESTYFNNRIENLIQWAPDAFYIWSPQNIGEAKISGMENRVALSLPDNKASLSLTHTWIDATDESGLTSNKLIYRPANKIDVTLGTTWFGVYLGIQSQWIDNRFVDSENTTQLDAYSLLHGKLSRAFKFSQFAIDVSLQGLNLLDESIVIVDGYPSPGRELRFSIGITY